MKATLLLYKTQDANWYPKGKHKCFFCGCDAELKYSASSTFMDYDKISNPESKYICEACDFSVNNKFDSGFDEDGKEKRNAEMRNFSHLCTETEWIRLSKGKEDRKIIKEFIFKKHDTLWFACIADSLKKQLLFRTPVNYPQNDITEIQFEELRIFISSNDNILFEELLYLNRYFCKKELIDGNLNINNLVKYRNENNIKKIDIIYKNIGNPIWNFLIWLLY
jgi:hypothetical protein